MTTNGHGFPLGYPRLPKKRPVRIAGCSGAATDRRDAMRSLASNQPKDPVDVIIGDWMSEANMTSRGAAKSDLLGSPSAEGDSYEPTFLEALEPALPHLAKYGIKVAVNAGASDTKALHAAVTKMIALKGLSMKVAWIGGDEVLPAVLQAAGSKRSPFENVSTGEKLSNWKFKPVYAQAYLGGLGIAAAFSKGADIVVCGRVSDASLIIGSACWFHGWESDDLDCLANALVCGHLIECSTYVCGGNYTGFKSLYDKVNVGFPIAEISPKGQVIITKQRNTGGEVSVGTCTSQLLYEIQGPWYFNSDVTADLTNIYFEQLSHDRVALHGVGALPPPPTTKVGITAKGGFQAELHWYLVGLDIPDKAAMMESQVRKLLAPHIDSFSRLEFNLIGSSPDNPTSQTAATVTFRVVAQAPNAEDLAPSKFARPCLDPIMQAYPGATPHLDLRTAFPRPIYEYFVTLLPQSAITHVVYTPFTPSSPATTIAPPAPHTTRTYPSRQPSQASSLVPISSTPHARGGLTDAAGGWAELEAPAGRSVLRESFGPWGRTLRGPLGWIAHARSGDKGSDANVGFWVRRKDEYEWLRRVLSVRKVQELLGDEWAGGKSADGKDKSIDRFELPKLYGVHFLLRNHLDRGVSCTTNLDCLGKNVAEFLRARWVDLPVRFLERGKL